MYVLSLDPPSGPMLDGLTFALGIVTGVLSGAFGVGGAIVSTPGLRLLGVPALVAVGTTLPPILPGAAVGTARYLRQSLVDWRVVAATAPAGMAAAIAGSFASHEVPGDGHWLMVLTAGLLGLSALRIARSRPPKAVAPDVTAVAASARPSVAVAAAVGASAGLLSGLLGVGGGIILVPAFSEVMGLPLKKAIATSLACVGILAVPSTVTHALLGDINWRLAILLTVAVIPGARMGAAAAMAASDRRLRLVVAAVLGVTALVYGGGELASL